MAVDTLSAGVIVVRRHLSDWLFLMLEAYGYWDFPKGIVEEGEIPIDTAIREVEEETTIKDLNFKWGDIYKDSRPYRGGRKVARYFIAVTETEHVELPVSPELGHPEHDSFAWLTYEDASKLVADRVAPILDWANSIIRK